MGNTSATTKHAPVSLVVAPPLILGLGNEGFGGRQVRHTSLSHCFLKRTVRPPPNEPMPPFGGAIIMRIEAPRESTVPFLCRPMCTHVRTSSATCTSKVPDVALFVQRPKRHVRTPDTGPHSAVLTLAIAVRCRVDAPDGACQSQSDRLHESGTTPNLLRPGSGWRLSGGYTSP